MSAKHIKAIKRMGEIVDEWLPLCLQYNHVPGAVVCIAHKGVPLYWEAFGRTSPGGAPLKRDNLFRIASMSKMFTSTAILLLQDRGTLRLDDAVVNFLPWFKGIKNGVNLSSITVRQLLSHTSGITRDGVTHHWSTNQFPRSLNKLALKDTVVFENNTTFKYSNHAFALLGAVIEKVSGFSYEEFVSREILKPLGLHDTYPDLPDKIPTKLLQGNERYIPNKAPKKVGHIRTNAYASATGFISSAPDVANFLSSLSPRKLRALLSKEARKEMTRVQAKDEEKGEYGLGLRIANFNKRTVIGHGGGFAGFITKSLSDIEHDIQVVVLTNTISQTGPQVAEGIVKTLHHLIDKNITSKVSIKRTSSYRGVYRDRWDDTAIVPISNTRLVGFSVCTFNPSEDWTVLERKGVDIFKNTETVGYGYPGEMVTFSQFVRKIPQKIVWGAVPASRL